jgi:hypothetical protein
MLIRRFKAFLLVNVALTGIPLLCFFGFALNVFIFSLITALLGAIVVALLFTAFMVFIASLFILPTIFFTTMSASFLFLWGLGGYYIFAYLQDTGVAPSDEVIDDKINTWTGGRFSWSTRGAKKASTSKERPKAGEKDSAISLEEEPILGKIEEVASDVENESDPEQIRELAMSIDSHETITSPTISLASQMELPEEEKAPTGIGLPITYAQLRKEHPDGLRLDRKGLFKVDDIASNSSLEDTRERTGTTSSQKTVKAHSRNTTAVRSPPKAVHSPITAIHSPIENSPPTSPKTIPKAPIQTSNLAVQNIDSDTSTRAVGIEEILSGITTQVLS